MWIYLYMFVQLTWPFHGYHRTLEVSAIVDDVLTTDATAEEALTLLNIAHEESGFERSAVGREGERGAFQVHPPAASYGAREALRRLRSQGITGYMGCSRPCPRMAERRTWPAKLYRMAFDPPNLVSSRLTAAAVAVPSASSLSKSVGLEPSERAAPSSPYIAISAAN